MKKEKSTDNPFPQPIRNQKEQEIYPFWKMRKPANVEKGEYTRYSGDPDRL